MDNNMGELKIYPMFPLAKSSSLAPAC